MLAFIVFSFDKQNVEMDGKKPKQTEKLKKERDSR